MNINQVIDKELLKNLKHNTKNENLKDEHVYGEWLENVIEDHKEEFNTILNENE